VHLTILQRIYVVAAVAPLVAAVFFGGDTAPAGATLPLACSVSQGDSAAAPVDATAASGAARGGSGGDGGSYGY